MAWAVIWKNQTSAGMGCLFRARSIYFLYLLAHFSFYFQQIHFQTFFHLPSLLLSCCFFCTQAGNLFWRRYFNTSSSQQTFCLLAHLYLNTLVHHRMQLEDTWWDTFSPQNPQSQLQSGSCNMHTLWKPTAKSQYYCTEEGREGKSIEIMLR